MSFGTHHGNSLKTKRRQKPPKKSVSADLNSDASSIANDVMDKTHVQQRLYVINRNGTGEAQYILLNDRRDAIESYGVRLETWRAIKGISNFGVIVLNNILYVIGGYDVKNCRHLHRVVKYDPYEFAWSDCAPMIKARAKFGACVIDGKIIVSGGERSDGQASCSCEVYDPDADTWSEGGLMVAPRKNHCCVMADGDMYLAGGDFGLRSHDNLWVYQDGHWVELDMDCPQKMPKCIDRYDICYVGHKIYFVGGVSCKASNTPNDTRFITERGIFSYTPNISTVQKLKAHPQGLHGDMISPWNTRYPSMVRPRHSCAVRAIGKSIYVFGGCHLETGQDVRVCECFNTDKAKWEDEFHFRKGDLSSVTTAVLAVPRRHDEEKINYKLKWVLW
ncbi:kelch-like protein 13 [Dreissena polymorpha]|uniref:Uncharacterized protein n=1 Tax=Dreissena polymorpha TaxID=45954 RepID=A0A9D3Z5D6_DREPO|nr:kelch-like protein 13 [Dreissena polymorpha]XP_052251936.1 kelch-like protein 13 [Dreissena polymorpha]KAH3710607.1 hypothetical protein DPMN_070096 [Dreissena polymorpha]